MAISLGPRFRPGTVTKVMRLGRPPVPHSIVVYYLQMILRLSHKMMKKVKCAPTQVLPLEANPYSDWSTHLFTASRTQYILVTNTASLYSVIMYGRGITDESLLIERMLVSLREVMAGDALSFFYMQFVAPAAGEVQISKALNRSVIGSMNEMVEEASYYLLARNESPLEVSLKLNEMPLSAVGYRNPREALKTLHGATAYG